MTDLIGPGTPAALAAATTRTGGKFASGGPPVICGPRIGRTGASRASAGGLPAADGWNSTCKAVPKVRLVSAAFRSP